MIHHLPPKNFTSRYDIVGCFVEYNGQILLLHRQDEDIQGNKWGLPAGKLEPGETEVQAMIRELREETGLKFQEKDLNYFQKVFVRYDTHDFLFHMFFAKPAWLTAPEILIDPEEHKDFRWLKPEKALQLELIRDLDGCIKLFYEEKK